MHYTIEMRGQIPLEEMFRERLIPKSNPLLTESVARYEHARVMQQAR
jgi:hypothetical protein